MVPRSHRLKLSSKAHDFLVRASTFGRQQPGRGEGRARPPGAAQTPSCLVLNPTPRRDVPSEQPAQPGAHTVPSFLQVVAGASGDDSAYRDFRVWAEVHTHGTERQRTENKSLHVSSTGHRHARGARRPPPPRWFVPKVKENEWRVTDKESYIKEVTFGTLGIWNKRKQCILEEYYINSTKI